MAAYPTRPVNNTGQPLTGPGGVLLSTTNITFTLVDTRGVAVAAIDALTSERVVGSVSVTTDGAGEFSVNLWPNDRGNIQTRYKVEVDYPGVESFMAALPYDDGSALSWTTPFERQEINAFVLHVTNQADTHSVFSSTAPGFVPATGSASSTDVIRADGTWGAPTSPGSGHVIQDAGTGLTQRANLNFVGATVTDDSGNDATVVTISSGGSAHVIQEEGVGLTARANLNFIGAALTAADDSGNNATTVTLGTIPVAGGGTGSTTASGARTALGLAIGTDVQAFDAGLTDIAGLAVTDSNFIVGNGSNWVAETGATARTSLGLGSLATQSTVNNADWSGTALAVANGGTGSTTASAARSALGIEDGMSTVQHKFDATTAPTTTDDSAAGFAVGSVWVDVTADRFYVCVDATASAAVWTSRLELSAENLYTAHQRMTLQTDTSSSGSVTFDFAGGDCFIDLTENITSIAVSNLPENAWATLIIQQGSGGNTVTGWPAAVKWPAATAPTISTTDNAYDVISLYKKGSDILASVSQDHR